MSYCWFSFRKQCQRLLVLTNTTIHLSKKKKSVNILCNTVRKEKNRDIV